MLRFLPCGEEKKWDINSTSETVVSFRVTISYFVYAAKLTHTSPFSPPIPRVANLLNFDNKDSLEPEWQNVKTFHVQHAKRLN